MPQTVKGVSFLCFERTRMVKTLRFAPARSLLDSVTATQPFASLYPSASSAILFPENSVTFQYIPALYRVLELLLLFRYNGSKEKDEAVKKQKYLSQRERMAAMTVEERREFSSKGGKATQAKKRAGPSLYTMTSTEGGYHIIPPIFSKPL